MQHVSVKANTLKKKKLTQFSAGVKSEEGNKSESSKDLSEHANMNFDKLEAMNNHFKDSRHKFLSSDGRYIYHIAIIDYLQYYNFDKKMENFVKTIWRGKKSEISAVPPERYMKRYIDFMENEVIISERKKNSVKNFEDKKSADEKSNKSEGNTCFCNFLKNRRSS